MEGFEVTRGGITNIKFQDDYDDKLEVEKDQTGTVWLSINTEESIKFNPDQAKAFAELLSEMVR